MYLDYFIGTVFVLLAFWVMANFKRYLKDAKKSNQVLTELSVDIHCEVQDIKRMIYSEEDRYEEEFQEDALERILDRLEGLEDELKALRPPKSEEPVIRRRKRKLIEQKNPDQ